MQLEVVVTVPEICPYIVAVSTLDCGLLPASNCSTKLCGTDEDGSHVAQHS